MMEPLNLPNFEFKIRKNQNDKTEIFDVVRKKWLVLTPEEWVRQHFVMFLIENKKFPASLMAIEKGLKVNNRPKRTDIVQYNRQGFPQVIVECKAPKIKVTEDTFAQAAMYNMEMKVDYLVITNGLTHYCCKINNETHQLQYLKEIPMYDEL